MKSLKTLCFIGLCMFVFGCNEPTFNPEEGLYYDPVTVEITNNINGGTVYYTLDGTTPTDASTEYTAPIDVDEDTIIKAIAIKGNQTSDVASGVYRIEEGPVPAGIAITNVTVIDAVNGVREMQTVIFDGDEITAVQSADLPISVVESIDGTGKFLIPGLWDFHIHVTGELLLKKSIMKLLLSYGITSIRDTGSLMDKITPLVEASKQEGTQGPRIFYSGPLLDGAYVVTDVLGTANTEADMASATVAGLKAEGVDFIKIYEMVSPEVFSALVVAVNEEGLPIAAHIPLSTLASEAGPQVDSMEHLRNVLLDCTSNPMEMLDTRLALLENPGKLSGRDLRSSIHADQRPKALENYDDDRCESTIAALSSTIQTPTLTLNSAILKPYFRDDWQDALNRLPRLFRSERASDGESRAEGDDGTQIPDDEEEITYAERQLLLVKRMHDMGVPIAAGTDFPVPITIPGHNLHLEMAALVHAGLSPLDAIGAATLRPAEFFSLQDEMGSIDVGKRSDMILLDSDPLSDIENTRTISTVVTKGVVLNSEDIELIIQESANSICFIGALSP
ncbi:MAG: amidohydrolase family protein [Proteobacteria bacterium]|nr:amidohydrolase family protein [Pseudomonadota bacterium]